VEADLGIIESKLQEKNCPLANAVGQKVEISIATNGFEKQLLLHTNTINQ
jgi:hypothetical protein